MPNNYIISQVLVVFAMLSLGLSYLCKDKKKIMILCILSSAFYGTQYILLGAITGFAMNVVSIIRNIWFYINAKKERKNDIWVLIILCLIALILGIISYDNIFSLTALAATLLFTYTVWQDNTKVYRWLALVISALWITYNIFFKSIFGVISELVLLIFEIIGIIKIQKQKKSFKSY